MSTAANAGHFSDLILSEHVRISTDIYFHQLALNTIIIGATRSGKSRFFVKPNLLQMNCNYIVTDPKGELLDATGSTLRSFGYRVRVFDINDKERCNTYNPLKYITCEEDVAILAQQLMDSTKLDEEGGGGGKDPFWDLSSLALLRACIYLLWKYADDAEIMGGKTYVSCFASINLLLALAMEREGKTPQSATLEGSYLDQIFERVKQRGREQGTMPYCCIAWDQIKGNPLNPTAATIVANTTSRLNMFSIDRIRDLTSSDNIDLNTFGEQKDALFLIMHPTDKTFNFLLNMMYSQLFNSIYRRGNHLTGCKFVQTERGEFIRFWRPDKKESREAFEARVAEQMKSMLHPTIRKHDYLYEIIDGQGNQITARPTQELAEEFCTVEIPKLVLKDMHGTMFPFHNRFILDEFFNVGKIPNFMTVLSTIAGYNGSCDIIIQDINQIKTMYEKEWGSAFGNCPINIVLKVADNETAKYVSESLGKSTIAHAQEQASETSMKASNKFQIETKQRDLMTMDEVKAMPKTHQLIIVSGENPLYDTKHPYTTHPMYQYTADATHIQFDRRHLTIKPVSLTKEVLSPSYAPKVEILTTEKIINLFQPDGFSFDRDDEYDSDFDTDDFDGAFAS